MPYLLSGWATILSCLQRYIWAGWASTRNDSCARSCVSTPSWEKSWTIRRTPRWCLKRWCPSFAGFDELPEIELCGFRLAVGGVNLLGAVPKTFAFHLFGLQEVFRHGIGIWYSGLEQFDRNHSLVPQQVPICLFLSVTEGGKAGVFFDRWKIRFREKRKWIQDKNYLNQETLSGKFFL